MKLEITESHIEDGDRGDCSNCPIALALRELCGTDDVYVDGVFISAGDRTWKTPDAAAHFIEDFDSGLPVGPITLELPDDHKL